MLVVKSTVINMDYRWPSLREPCNFVVFGGNSVSMDNLSLIRLYTLQEKQ
ncbi:hypothetical protein HanOQP8_Chr09g0317451 [Helianthus annuus]|nr:hypothetical protein HanHA89_Chr09g0332371 [Helianthus annuus]KAJ0706855.1 hypothetical protein HanLR1_Chr09g0311831 [Helianthus annuus]KAJ0710878.1 hypothetical protein HanOQP8_Chr09g0317451 [Helianthus annuus]